MLGQSMTPGSAGMGQQSVPANASNGGMRPNYSSNSLAAAEQLEALMRHQGGGLLGSEPPPMGAPGPGEQDSLLFGGHGPPDGFGGVSAPIHHQGGCCGGAPGSSSRAPQSGPGRGSMPFGGDSAFMSQPNLERGLEFAQGNLPLLLRSGAANDPACMRAVLNESSALSGVSGGMHPGAGYGGVGGVGGVGNNGLSSQQLASSLSILHYAGAAALGPGGGAPHGGQHMGGGDQAAEAHQKRRFVWTTELHAKFEAACNQLGLDNAKPKSILRLMNVDGLTKANIKSHLQKYRCSVQKKAMGEAAEGGPSGGSVKSDDMVDAEELLGPDSAAGTPAGEGRVGGLSETALLAQAPPLRFRAPLPRPAVTPSPSSGRASRPCSATSRCRR